MALPRCLTRAFGTKMHPRSCRRANRGAQLASGRILLLLNPDTIVRPRSLAALVRALEEDDVGAAGGLLLREDGEEERGFAVRRFPTPLRMAAEILAVEPLLAI